MIRKTSKVVLTSIRNFLVKVIFECSNIYLLDDNILKDCNNILIKKVFNKLNKNLNLENIVIDQEGNKKIDKTFIDLMDSPKKENYKH